MQLGQKNRLAVLRAAFVLLDPRFDAAAAEGVATGAPAGFLKDGHADATLELLVLTEALITRLGGAQLASLCLGLAKGGQRGLKQRVVSLSLTLGGWIRTSMKPSITKSLWHSDR